MPKEAVNYSSLQFIKYDGLDCLWIHLCSDLNNTEQNTPLGYKE